MSFRPFTSATPQKIGLAASAGFSESPARADHTHPINLTAPLSLDGSGNLTISQANATTPGFLSAADWNTFNSVGNTWSRVGNAGTNPATNFIGTTDAQPFKVRVNNVEQISLETTGALRLGSTSAAGITGSERLIINDANGAYSDFAFVAAGGGWPVINLGSSGGTPTARTALANGSNLGSFIYWGYDGSAWQNAIEIRGSTVTVGAGSVIGKLEVILNGVSIASMTSSGLALAGSPTSPTPAIGDYSDRIATTAFVTQAQGFSLRNSFHSGTIANSEAWYAASAEAGATMTTLALVANTLYAVPFAVARRMQLDRLAFSVATSKNGSSTRIGIYSSISNNNLTPSTLIYDSGSISTATSGSKFDTTAISITLDPGLYWFVILSTTNVTVRAFSSANSCSIFGYGPALNGSSQDGLQVTVTYGSLPDTYPIAGAKIMTGNIPAIFARFSS